MPSNLRIIYDNAADRATLTSTSTVATLPASNLLVDIKSAVWRGTGTSAQLTLQWTTAQTVAAVALAFCNLTTTSTLRVRAYTLAADAAPVLDVTRTAVRGSDPIFNVPHSQGGDSYAVAYFPVGAYEKVIVNVTDVNNPAGYLQASRLICGNYWSPVYNVEHGNVTLGLVDTSKSERTDAGDLRTDRGTIHKTLQFDLSYMPAADRTALYSILRNNGTYRPMLVSVTPEDDDADGEQIFQVYGKLSRMAQIRFQFMNQFGTQLDIEET